MNTSLHSRKWLSKDKVIIIQETEATNTDLWFLFYTILVSGKLFTRKKLTLTQKLLVPKKRFIRKNRLLITKMRQTQRDIIYFRLPLHGQHTSLQYRVYRWQAWLLMQWTGCRGPYRMVCVCVCVWVWIGLPCKVWLTLLWIVWIIQDFLVDRISGGAAWKLFLLLESHKRINIRQVSWHRRYR